MRSPHNVSIACDVLDQETQDVHAHEENNITKIVIKICDFFGESEFFFKRKMLDFESDLHSKLPFFT